MSAAPTSLEEFWALPRNGLANSSSSGGSNSREPKSSGTSTTCHCCISQNPRSSQPKGILEKTCHGSALQPFGALPLYLTLSLISSCVLSNTAGDTVLLVRYQKGSLTLTLSLQLFVTGHQSINIT